MTPDQVIRSLAPFDSADFAAAIGALQLCPENADQLFQLEGAATVAAALSPRSPGPSISGSRLRRLFTVGELGLIAYANDPHTGPFIEEVAFTGGSYRVFGGSIDDSVFRFRRVLDALFRAAGPKLPAAPIADAERMIGIALTVLDRMLRQAGLSTDAEASVRPGGSVTVPDGERLRRLKAALTLHKTGFEAIDPAVVNALKPLTLDQGSIKIARLDPPNLIDGPLKTRPFVSVGDRLILGNPGVVLGAIAHAVITALIGAGAEGALAERFQNAVYANARTSLRRIRFREEEVKTVAVGSGKAMSAKWRADADRICHVLVVTDDFTAYDHSDPYSTWKFPVDDDGLRTVCRRFEAELGAVDPGTKVLHLILTETLGRSMFLGSSGEIGNPGNPDLLITAGDLETLSWLRYGDPQFLFNYAFAHDALTKETRVMTFGNLDLFQLWDAKEDSFYFGDDRRPNQISVTPSAGAAELRRKAHRMRMVHGAPWVDPRALVEVQRVDLEIAAPIFAPTEVRSEMALLVELPAHAWVVSERPASPNHVGILCLVVDAVAYWLWQVTRQPVGRVLFQRLPQHVVVRVKVEAPDAWAESAVLDDEGDARCECVLVGNDLELRVPRQMAKAFNRSDNEGERDLLAVVLSGVVALMRKASVDLRGINVDDKAIERLVDAVAPLGPKKKIVLLGLDADSVDLRELDDLPRHRLIQDATIAGLLDGLGAHLRIDKGRSEGRIADGERTLVLNEAVAYFRERLQAEVVQLEPHALEAMVARHERTLFEQATGKLMVSAKLACYSDFPETVAKARKQLPELSRLAVAQRVAIEYMTTVPPSGSLPLTTARADLITALALDMVNYGMISDAIHFKLTDRVMNILPSGRLGISRDEFYETAQSRFIDQTAASTIEEDVERFPERWALSAEPTVALKQKVADLDAAAAAEFGFTFTDMKILTEALITIAGDQSVVTMKESALIAMVAETVGWEQQRVAKMFGELTLTSRPDFLNPPTPYTPRDVQPWLFNRRLSYLRRPLLRRGSGVDAEIVYGLRLLMHVGPYLMGLCTSARLTHVRSHSMAKVIEQVRNADTKAFNHRVAELCRSDPKLTVDENVTKVLGKKVARANGDLLGDLDVLVIDTRRRRIRVIETKDLGVARNPREMDNQLTSVFSMSGPKPSDATRHVERVEWVRSNLPRVLERYGINANGDKWTVEGLFVVDQDLMTHHLANVPMPVLSARQLVREGWLTRN